jgi:hypothetical protein
MVKQFMKIMQDKLNLLMPNGNVISIENIDITSHDSEGYNKIRDSLIANQIN